MSVSRLVNSKIFVVIAAISCIITAFIGYDSAPKAAPEKEKCTLVRVVDGDTYIASLNGEEKRIRLIGVNTPESVAPADYAENTAEGEKVSEIVKNKLREGDTLLLEYDTDRTDKYDRTLAYVYLPDGTMIQEWLLENGYAEVMTIPPNVRYAERFEEIEQKDNFVLN